MIYRFGDCELDTALFELRKGGVASPVEPQVFDLLKFLVEHRDRVVTRQEILDAVWPDRIVSDSTLSSRLKVARKAIGDSGRAQSLIRTMHGRGVRFTGDVEQEEPGEGTVSTVVPPPDRPATRYARSGVVNIAYQVVGSGPVDIVFVMGWVSHLEMFWAEPSFARFLRRLASFSRLILFDKRGTGLSDHVPPNELPTLEQRMDDVRAVMDAVGSRRAVVIGVSEGAPMSALFAATYPQRCSGLVLIGGYARRLHAPDYPFGEQPDRRASFIEHVQRKWGGPVGLEARAPGKAADPAFREWWATYLRMGASPAAVLALMEMNDLIDVRDVLPTIRVPSLVIHRRDERTLSVEHGRYLAAHIPGAEYVEPAGEDHLPFVGDQDDILGPIQRFVERLDPTALPSRSLASVMVVRGEELTSRMAPFETAATLFGGEIRNATDAELVLVFDGPGRAVRAALASIGSSRVAASAAIHTGECEIGESVKGPAFDFASAAAALTPRGEVWVSSTVHDLVAGSGLAFRSVGRSLSAPSIGSRELFALVRE